jgi:hypothetical protein
VLSQVKLTGGPFDWLVRERFLALRPTDVFMRKNFFVSTLPVAVPKGVTKKLSGTS